MKPQTAPQMSYEPQWKAYIIVNQHFQRGVKELYAILSFLLWWKRLGKSMIIAL